MDFVFSESQNIMINSIRSFLLKEAKNLARNMEKTPEGYSREIWQKMAALGCMGIIFPEEYGGTVGDFLDLILLLEEMGKALVPGPFIPTIVSGAAILQYGSELQKQQLLPKLIDGELILSYAFFPPDAAILGEVTKDQVVTKDEGYVLSGTRVFVPFGHTADCLVYYTNISNSGTLFLINTTAPGVKCTPLESLAGDKPSEVILDGVEVSRNSILGETGKGREIRRKIEELGALAHSGFIVGMLGQVLKMSVDHAKEREQFDSKIGSFQAIQHQCADMATDIEQAKYLTYYAAWKLAQGVPAQKEISMAKAWASDISRRVGLLGVKILGGTGVSEEHDMQLYFRNAKASEQAFGDGDFHREVVAQQFGL